MLRQECLMQPFDGTAFRLPGTRREATPCLQQVHVSSKQDCFLHISRLKEGAALVCRCSACSIRNHHIIRRCMLSACAICVADSDVQAAVAALRRWLKACKHHAAFDAF